MCLKLFELPESKDVFSIFHDESGNIISKDERWFLHGIVIGNDDGIQDIYNHMTAIKKKNSFLGEINYGGLGSIGKSLKFKVANEWLELFFISIS